MQWSQFPPGGTPLRLQPEKNGAQHWTWKKIEAFAGGVSDSVDLCVGARVLDSLETREHFSLFLILGFLLIF